MMKSLFAWVVEIGAALSVIACANNENLVAAAKGNAGAAGSSASAVEPQESGGASGTTGRSSNAHVAGARNTVGGAEGGVDDSGTTSNQTGGSADEALTVLPEHRTGTTGDECIRAISDLRVAACPGQKPVRAGLSKNSAAEALQLVTILAVHDLLGVQAKCLGLH